MASELRSFDVFIDKDSLDSGIKQILAEIRPEWKQDQIQIKTLTGGNQNTIVLCRPSDGDCGKDGLVFRVFGTYSNIYNIDKEREIGNVRLLNLSGQGSRLVARFRNGYIVKYVTGETLTSQQCADPEILRLIAEEIAGIHSASSGEGFQPVRDSNCEPEDFNHFQPIIRSCLQKLEEGFSHPVIDKRIRDHVDVALYRSEYSWLMETLEGLAMEVRLCHNDIGPANLILNPQKDAVTLVDFESCDVNFVGFDLSKVFTFTAGFPIDVSKIPSDDVIKTFLHHYLRHRRTLEKTSADVTKEDTERLYKETYNCFVLSLLMLSIFLPTLERKNIENGSDVDFTGMSISYWKEYKKRKDTLFLFL